MILDDRVYERGNRLRRSTLRHSLDRGPTNFPTVVAQRSEQMRRVVRFVVAKSLSRIQPRRLIAFGQTCCQVTLTFESLCDVFDSDDETGNRVVITQRRDRDSLLHHVEMFSWNYWSTGD